jgi:pentatricopeptide repeat protein
MLFYDDSHGCKGQKQGYFQRLSYQGLKTGEVEKALNLLEEMSELGLTPTNVTFNALINACSKREDILSDTLHFSLFFCFPTT